MTSGSTESRKSERKRLSCVKGLLQLYLYPSFAHSKRGYNDLKNFNTASLSAFDKFEK